MDKLRRILFPPIPLLVIISVISYSSLAYVFLTGRDESSLSIVVYCLSAYSLEIIIARIVRGGRSSALKFKENEKFASIFDKELRLFFSLSLSTLISALHGTFSIVTGFLDDFIFSACSGIYYILLAFIRFGLLKNIRKDVDKQETKSSAFMLLSTNFVMIIVISIQVLEGRAKSYSGSMIYAVAVYTFYMIILSSVNLKRTFHSENRALKLARSISFSVALVSMFSLQLSMLSAFGNDPVFAHRMNMISGAVVSLLLLVISGIEIYRNRRT